MEKQEEAEETVEECIARVKAANEGISDEEARAKCTKKEPEAEKALGDKLIAVMKEYTDAAVKEAKLNTERRLAEMQKETENELIESIRKGLGLNKDPVVHLSEVEGLIRKIMLDKTPPGKRTETETPEKPSGEATPKIEKADDIYKRLTQNRMAI